MNRRALLAFACLGTLALAAAGLLAGGAAGSGKAVSSTLYAGFDADGNIYLTFADGTRIGSPTAPGTVVPAGTYTIQLDNNGLDDMGGTHFFHLAGPGVNLSAGQNLYATATWSATFQPAATYVYSDDANATVREVFGTPGSGAGTSTASATTTTTPKSSGKPTDNSPLATTPPAPRLKLRGTLIGSVSAAGKLTLTSKGKPVSSLAAGRYTFRVTDASRTNGFTVQEAKKSPTSLTAIPYVGTRSVSIDLRAGQWFFYPTAIGKKTYFIVHG